MQILTFRALIEALKIIKKSTKTVDDKDYGSVGSYKIKNSEHATDARNGVKRNDHTNIKLLKDIIRDFFKHVPNPKNGKYDIIYKRPNYNKLVIGVRSKEVKIITIIQDDRKSNTYKPQKGQTQVPLDKLFEDVTFIEAIFFED